jgi:hypothetical protein
MQNSRATIRTAAGASMPPVLERYVQQNKEWQSFVCAKLTAPMERVLRDLHFASVMAAKHKGIKNPEPIFRMIISRVSQWTDDECAKEFSDAPREVDACIRMAVRAHAIVMALTISRQCREVIRVPNSQTFFRRVLMDTAGEHGFEVFGTQDFSVRKRLRNWITDNIVKHLMSLVPVSLFTEEDGDDDYSNEAVPSSTAEDKKEIDLPIANDGGAPPEHPNDYPIATTPLESPGPLEAELISPVCDSSRCTLPSGETVSASDVSVADEPADGDEVI